MDINDSSRVEVEVIDTHVHFWKYDKERDAWITDDMKLLQQDYLPQQLETTLKRNGVTGCIAVQADQSELETHFLLELAKSYSFIKGITGWIDIRNENLPQRLEYFAQYPLIKAWRHVVQAEPMDFLLQPEFNRGIELITERGYIYEILIYHNQLPAAIEFVSRHPNQVFVLDHCAKPNIKEREIADWKKHIKQLAQFQNVHCKISGLFTEARIKAWSAADFYPYLDVVFENFGINRVVYGSDWPVMLLSGMYVQWKSLLEKYMENHTREERQQFFGGNAQLLYQI